MKNVAIVILNFNGTKDTLECLATTRQLSTNNYQLTTIIVDNGSDEKLKVNDEKLIVIRNKKNLGFAGGNNVGIKHALKTGVDYIIILNNDTIVSANLVGGLLKTFEEEKNAGIVSPKIYFAPGFEFHKERYEKEDLGKVIWYMGGKIDWENILASHFLVDEIDIGKQNEVTTTDYASGACMMVKKEVFDKIGFFDPLYFLYWEDADFSQRAKKAGFKVLVNPKTFIWHKNSGSSKIGGSLHDYYLTRNRLLFAFRYGSTRARFALLQESFLKLIFGKRVWQKKGIIDFFLRKFGRGSYPI